jgi:hypothetical protein
MMFDIKNIILTFLNFLKSIIRFFQYKDFHIKTVKILYRLSDYPQITEVEDVTDEYKTYGPASIYLQASKNVIFFVFKITYFFNNKHYIYLTSNPEHPWPPKKRGMTFCMPIKEAFLLDANDVPVYNVTSHIKNYAGPHGDFHGETIKLSLIEGRREYPKIRMTNAMNQTVEYNIATDEINHQSIWLPGKT